MAKKVPTADKKLRIVASRAFVESALEGVADAAGKPRHSVPIADGRGKWLFQRLDLRKLKNEDGIDVLEVEPGPKGDRGAQGRKGRAGKDGLDGDDGASAYRLWLDAGNTGTRADFLKALKGDRGRTGKTGKAAYQEWLDAGNEGTRLDFVRSLRGPSGYSGGSGGPGPAGPQGLQGLPGADGGESVPKSATLTRDANGSVQSVTVAGKPTWTITRNPDGSVAGLANTEYDVAVDRDVDGIVEGVTVEDA